MCTAKSAPSGAFDAALIDTTPGSESSGLFTPPADFTGDNKAYYDWFIAQHSQPMNTSMRAQYQFHVTFFEREAERITFEGPYVEVVQAMLKDSKEKRRIKRAKHPVELLESA